MLVGEGGAEGCEAGVAAVAAEGDGDGVHGAFDDHRDGAGTECAVELVALVEQRGFAGVEVLGSGAGRHQQRRGCGVRRSRGCPLRVGDGEDDAVAELVDESSGGGGAGDAGGEHLGVGDALLAEVVDEVRPAGGGVAGLDEWVACQVGAEPVGEVLLGPGAGELGGVEVLGELVDLDEPFSGDGAGAPRVGAVHLARNVGVGGFGGAHDGAH